MYKWDIFPYDDVKSEFERLGCDVEAFDFTLSSHVKDDKFEAALFKRLASRKFDAVFSINYFTAISNVCRARNVKYISWTCDAPLLSMRNPSIRNPKNTIYVFDKKELEYFKNIDSVKYLPLAGAPERVQKLLGSAPKKYRYDISFVGNLYDKNRYDEMASCLPDYLCGYMDAAIEAQLNISCGSIFNYMLNDDILNELEQYIDLKIDGASTADIKLHFATSVLSYKAAAVFRTRALNALARTGADVHLFTSSGASKLIRVNVHPPVRYIDEAPFVFASSKINLNMTAPNIEDGIPLRTFDVISAGGFLLTDYRPAIADVFEIGKDVAVYDGIDDLVDKAKYYISHDNERERIAASGFAKLSSRHTYGHRIRKILDDARKI